MPLSASLGSLARNFAAYGASEAASKASRLLVVIAAARALPPAEIGIAAAALATSEILKALTETGAVQRIIAAPAARLEATCLTAHRLVWVWCLGLFLVQIAVAFVLWAVGGSVAVSILVAVLAGEYLFMPGGLVQAGLAMRENKLRQAAAITGSQVVLANILSVLLALIWPSALALILPKLLTAPVWLVAMRRLRPWRPAAGVAPAPLAPFLRFGWAVLAVEVVKALRLYADKLVVGLLLGAEALGLYFMAFNAGLSLSNAVSQAFATVLFPHLHAHADRAAALRESITLSLALTVPVASAQSLLAPVYVPLLLGAQYAELSSVVALLCLAAIPTMIWTAAAGWLRSCERPDLEFAVTLVLAAAVILNTVVLAPSGLLAIAQGYLAITVLIMTAASLPALATAFSFRNRSA
ncbi:oligosaccharide flippase family protein [Litorisediminicola beolgyonensis]|uniref:Oligosaccharide flippase family protein n=1 Tax=Litorisediminicola beolgyonensis TaxID=1173614 RepID=A0ABW3ZD50_9RHOB